MKMRKTMKGPKQKQNPAGTKLLKKFIRSNPHSRKGQPLYPEMADSRIVQQGLKRSPRRWLAWAA